MREAVRLYRSGSQRHCEKHISSEIEEFICWVLEQEPDKIQLHLCLGFVNFLVKKDYVSALRDFEKFLEVAPENKFSEEKRIARTYIGNVRTKLNSINA